jgi:RimJ/RimL family protein N-acetyltransferase
VIRRVEPEDWQLLRGVRLRALREDPTAFLATYDQESAFEDAQWQDRASQANGASFVAVDGETAEGLATGLIVENSETVVLVGMWVAPRLRGTGVAGELVDSVVAWARERGVARVRLSVERGNDRAARLYERCGFTEIERPSDLPYEPNDGNRFFEVAL